MSERQAPIFIAVKTPTHWQALVALMQDYLARDLNNPGLSSIHADIADPQSRYTPPLGQAWLMQCDDQWVGCGALASTRVAGLAELKRMYVIEAFRGQGLARRMAEHLLRQAGTGGWPRVGLSTWASNRAALSLYRSLGFSPIEPFKDHPDPELLYLGRPALP